MTITTISRAAAALAVISMVAGCTANNPAGSASSEQPTVTIPLDIKSANGQHQFVVELASTEGAQERGLMYRTDIAHDGGMLFAPYPPSGPPREARFWMKNTPSPLDIIFIRSDGSIAHIAENTTPFSEAPIPSGEPVAAVLELRGGRTAELGIAEDDIVRWQGRAPR